MRWLPRLWQKPLAEKKLDSELQFHIEQQIAENVAAGMSAEEARRHAKLEFGGMELYKEECRDARLETQIHSFFYDLRYAWRNLRKDVRFFVLSVCALALGIGSSTIIFSIVYNGMLHPFPYRASDRLVAVGFDQGNDPRKRQVMFQLDEIDAFKKENHTLEDVVAYSNWFAVYTNSSAAQNLHGARVSGNLTEFFGVAPLLGRGIEPYDEAPNAPQVAVLGFTAWKKYFQSDPAIIGRTILLYGKSFTVVGVMPKRFTVDGGDFWAPITAASRVNHDRNHIDDEPQYFFVSAILKRGVSHAAADADLQVIAEHLATVYPDRYAKNFSMRVQLLNDAVVADFRSILILLSVAVGMLMLISCSNVANLLLARATSREKEMALRASIGASRARLVRQLLAESFLLAVISCLAGCFLAYAGLRFVVPQLPGRIPGEADISMNFAALGFALTVSVLAVFLCGLSPALHAVGGDYRAKLSGTGPGSVNIYRHGKLRSGLVVAEIALAMVLLVCSGLIMRSFHALTHVNLGFDPSKVMSASLHFPKGRYETTTEKNLYLHRVLESISTVPGVEASSIALGAPPLDGNGTSLQIPGKQLPDRTFIMFDLCNETIFKILDFRLMQGRALNSSDIAKANRVAVVNQAFVKQYFENENPIGQIFQLPDLDELPETPHHASFEIVGVIADIQNRGFGDPPFPQAYLPYSLVGFGDRALLVRTSVDPNSVLKNVRQRIIEIDRDVAFSDAAGLNGMLSQALFVAPQFALFTISSFALIGLILVVIGVFGLMAYTVSLQKHEIGIRMALGAEPGNILRMVLGKGMRLLGLGIGAGIFIAYCIAWLLRHQFWQFSPADPFTYISVACLLIAVGLGSCWLPARRATRIDPMNALRYE